MSTGDDDQDTDNDVVESQVEAPVPFVGQKFGSWKEAESFLDQYATSNFFQWTTASSSSIRDQNKKLLSQCPTAVPYKEDLIHKNIKLTCVSGGIIRINNGKGERPFQA